MASIPIPFSCSSIFVAIFLTAMAIATDYIVGEYSGWTIDFDYQAWAKDKEFYGKEYTFEEKNGYFALLLIKTKESFFLFPLYECLRKFYKKRSNKDNFHAPPKFNFPFLRFSPNSKRGNFLFFLKKKTVKFHLEMKNEEICELSYDDFEPHCEWKREVGASIIKKADILEIHLQGFKEEELKNELRKDGFLYISGEHRMGNDNKIKRFNKKIDVSKYENKEIKAKFEAGKLHLRLPCKSSAISFLNIGKGGGRFGLVLRLDGKSLSSAMGVALLLILGSYMYKYFQCTDFWKQRSE